MARSRPRAVAAVLQCALTAGPTFAGYYAVSYSSPQGKVTIVGPLGGTREVPYGALSNGGWGGVGTSSEFIPPDQYIYGHGSVSCSGQIVATFTWMPSYDGDLPPSVVVVKETGGADWSGDSGACDDGLGHAAQPPAGPSVYHQDSFGSRYFVQEDPGNSFTRPCNPTASAVKAQGGPSPWQTASAGVSYIAGVYYPSLTISGVIDPATDHRLLIGQRLTATVSLGGLPTGAGDSYSWSVDKGAPFSDYTASDASATYVPFGSQNAPVMVCYFAKPDTGIKVQASVSLPTIGLAFSLAIDDIRTSNPTVWNRFQAIGTMQLLPNAQGPTELALDGAIQTNPPDVHGVFFQTSLQAPPPFPPSTVGEIGTWNFTQLVKPTISGVNSAGQTILCDNYALEGLDKKFPYLGPFSAIENLTGIFSDRPAVQLAGFNSMNARWDFKLYVMYLAPGQSKFVPIQIIPWHCAGQTATGSPSWPIWGISQAIGGVTKFPAHPTWTFAHLGG